MEQLGNFYGQYEDDIAHGRITKEQAEENVRKILYGAAQMKGVKVPALPPKKEKETFARTMLNSRGVSKPSTQQLDMAEDMHVKLQQAGYDETQILQIADNIDLDEATTQTELNRKLKVYVDYEKQPGRLNIVKEFLGPDASDKDIRQEYIERISVEKEFNLSEDNQREEKVTAIRAFEKNSERINRGKSTNRKVANRIIEGDMSDKELSEVKQRDKQHADTYKKIINGNSEMMNTELEKYNESKKNSRTPSSMRKGPSQTSSSQSSMEIGGSQISSSGES